MKCKCGQECIWYHEVEGWLCLKCDGKDINKIAEKYYKDMVEKLNKKEKSQCQD